MIKRLIICGVAASLLGLAVSQSHSQQQLADKEYDLKVNLLEINTIAEGLNHVEYGKAFPLINKLRSQVLEQQPKPEPAKQQEPNKDAPTQAK